MKKFIQVNKKYNILLIGIITVMCIASLVWVFHNDVTPAAGKSLWESINVEYDTVTAVIDDDNSVTQDFKTSANVYGVVLKFATEGQVVQGNARLDILQGNTVVATANQDLAELLNGVQVGVTFDTPVLATKDAEYTLKITFEYAEGEQNKISLWKNSSMESTLTENGNPSDGTLFLNIIVNISDTFIKDYYMIIAVLLIVAVAVSFVLIYVVKLKIHLVFLVVVILFGTVYNFVLPPHMAPDEKVHINTSYKIVNDILGETSETTNILMRKSDTEYTDNASDFNVFTYQTVMDNMFKQCEDSTLVETKATYATGVSYLSYTPTVAGMLLARVLNFNYITSVMFARMFNLIFFAVIISLAIKITPFAKNIFFATAFLPMSVSLAASFSYDAPIIALSILFIALCLKYAYQDEKMDVKKLVILAVVAVLLAPVKAVYIFVCGFCLIIPRAKFKNLKTYILNIAIVLVLATGSFLMANSQTLMSYVTSVTPDSLETSENAVEETNITITEEPVVAETAQEPAVAESVEEPVVDDLADAIAEPETTPSEPEINYIASVYYTPSYVLTHVRDTINLIGNTIQHNTDYYLRQMVGGHLVEPILIDVDINGVFICLLYICLILSCLQTKKDLILLKPVHKWWAGFICLCVTGVLLVVTLSWTPANNPTIWGMQGRYLLPILPLVLLILQGKNITLEKDITKHIAFTMCMLQFFVLLNALVAII